MSRIVVKNLPSEINEDDISKIFSQKGTLTAVDLKRNASGKSRHFAFIGYHDEHDADEAIRDLNQTFIKTNKIQVEKCHNLSKEGTNNISKTSLKRKLPSADKASMKKKPKQSLEIPLVQQNLIEKYKSDPEFAEFLDLKSPDQAAKVRASLNLPVTSLTENNLVSESVEVPLKPQKQKLKSREVINLLYHVKLRNIPKKTNKTMVKQFFHPLNCASIRIPKFNKGIAFVGFTHESERNQALHKDKSFIMGEPIRVIEYSEGNAKKKEINKGPKIHRLYFYNIPSTSSVDELTQLFSTFGELKSLAIPKLPNNDLKGFGLVTYLNNANAKNAYEDLSKNSLEGKIIINPEMSGKVPKRNLEECLQELGEPYENTEAFTKSKKWKDQEEALKNEESIAESGRIFFRNLSYTTQENDIENLFSPYGPISELNLPIDADTKQLKGFGTITFLMPEHAVKAFNELDGTDLHGRLIHLLPGKSKDKPDLEDSTNFKENKLNKQKAEARKAHNWNALFIDHNAVAEVVAEKFGTSKEAILGPEVKGSAAVRLALAETQVVNETKKYLEEMGVKLEAFNQNANVKRSKTIILVKNLPSKTESKELKTIFEKYGDVGRIILPPSGLTAIVEYLDPSQARKGFTCLAYSKFKHVPLYLEWAPEGSVDNKEVKKDNVGEDTSEMEICDDIIEPNELKNTRSNTDNAMSESSIVAKKDSDVLPIGDPEPETAIFVKNINFHTSNDTLRTHFEQIGQLYYAYVATKKADNSQGAAELSRGYGFVRYMRKNDADRALEELNLSILDGKTLELAKSDRAEKSDMQERKQSKDKQSKVKLLVKNVPFAAKKKEVEEIFRAFGGLKRVRLPKKIGSEANRHRGFAFVEFTNESDAKMAYEALHLSTHLLGRRLVLQWAKDDEDVDEIRKRTEEHYAPQKKAESKKSVFKID